VHGFWLVEFSHDRLGASHYFSDMFGLVLLSSCVSTLDLVTLKVEANEHPPLAILPPPIGPSASSATSSTGQKPITVLYTVRIKCGVLMLKLPLHRVITNVERTEKGKC